MRIQSNLPHSNRFAVQLPIICISIVSSLGDCMSIIHIKYTLVYARIAIIDIFSILCTYVPNLL